MKHRIECVKITVTMDNTIIKNQIFDTVIDGYTSEALGVCHINGRAVFVPGALIGEQCKVKILKVTSTAVYGKAVEFKTVSPRRKTPLCNYYSKCGGCCTRHMVYEAELEFKLNKVNDCLHHIGGLEFAVDGIIGSDKTERYRNKAIFAVGTNEDKAVSGFYRPRTHDVIDVEDCLLQSELSNKAALAVCGILNELKIKPYDEISGKGSVRHVFVRQGFKTNQAVCCIVSAQGFGKNTAAFTEKLKSAVPELTGIVLNINRTKGNTVLQGDFYTLWGEDCISDYLCGYIFRISPLSFFQINPPQAEKLYNQAVEYAVKTGDETVLDLYCGAGTISLCLARKAKYVYGAEIVESAIENADYNAGQNGLTNVRFMCADASDASEYFKINNVAPDAIVVDPPRKGLSEAVIDNIVEMAPQRLVYVSCNPATLARDMKLFFEKGYSPVAGKAVDMFPGTEHVETVVLLSRNKE